MFDMFIKIGAIKGESKDDRHRDEIEVQSWAWGEAQSGGPRRRGQGLASRQGWTRFRRRGPSGERARSDRRQVRGVGARGPSGR